MPYHVLVVDGSIPMIETDLYTVAASAECDRDYLSVTITLGYKFAKPAPDYAADPHWRDLFQNAMVFVGGRLVSQTFDRLGDPSSYQQLPPDSDGRERWVQRTNRGKVDLPPGPCHLLVKLYPNRGGPMATVSFPGFVIPPRPAPALLTGKFVRSLFNLGPIQLRDNPDLEDAVRSAGVSTLHEAVFENPYYSGVNSFAEWRAAYDRGRKANFAWMKEHGWTSFGTGDDFCRTAAERDTLVYLPWGRDAIRYAFESVAESGVCVGVEMVDEINVSPGSHPIYAILREEATAAGVKLAWPPPGSNPGPHPFEQGNWADYRSRYYINWDWRDGRPDEHPTLPQTADGLFRATTYPDLRPLVLELPASGSDYVKAEGVAPPEGGTTAADVVAATWVAVALKASAGRAYFFETKDIAAIPVGAYVETGTRPGDLRWPGIVAAFKSVAAREERIVSGHAYPAFASGPWLVGRRGDLTWIVNATDDPQASPRGGTLLTPSGESPVSAGDTIPPGGVLFT